VRYDNPMLVVISRAEMSLTEVETQQITLDTSSVNNKGTRPEHSESRSRHRLANPWSQMLRPCSAVGKVDREGNLSDRQWVRLRVLNYYSVRESLIYMTEPSCLISILNNSIALIISPRRLYP